MDTNSILNEDYLAAEKKALFELKSKVTSDSKISKYDITDAFLLKFLRARSHDVKVSFGLVKQYISLIRSRPDITDFDKFISLIIFAHTLFTWSDGIKTVIESGIYANYQHKPPSAQGIIVLQIGKWDPNTIPFEEVLRASLFIQEMMLMEDDVQRNGFVFLCDVHDMNLVQLYHMGIGNAMLMTQLSEQCMPIKVVNAYICFQNRFTDMIYSAFRLFLTEDMKQRIIFQGQLGNLFEKLPQASLPPLFNGTNEEPDLESAYVNVEKNREKVEKIWQQFKKVE